jgi:hypothetical protein
MFNPIRLLLHGIWQTWQRSGHRDHLARARSCSSSNPLQEALLARWGITLLTPECGTCVDDALVEFLADIKERVLMVHISASGGRAKMKYASLNCVLLSDQGVQHRWGEKLKIKR